MKVLYSKIKVLNLMILQNKITKIFDTNFKLSYIIP